MLLVMLLCLKFTDSNTLNSTEFSSKCVPETPGNLLEIRPADLLRHRVVVVVIVINRLGF